MKKYLVTYNTDKFLGLQIVIHCKDRNEARAILKKHLGSQTFTVKKITEENVNEN